MPINIKESIKNLAKPLECLIFIENEDASITFMEFLNQKHMGYLCLHPQDLFNLEMWLMEGVKPKFIVVEIENDEIYSELKRIMEHLPKEIKVITLGSHNDIEHYRRQQEIGISEYLLLPLNKSLLEQTYLKLIASESFVAKKNCIGVIGARNGVGVTSVATNIAYLWKEMNQERCCIIDLDPKRGDVSIHLNLQENHGLHELLTNVERVDDVLLQSIMTEKYPNYYVVTNDWSVTNDFASLVLSDSTFYHLFNLLHQQVDTLILDLSSITKLYLLNFIGQELTHLVLVTDLTLSAIRDALHLYTWFQTNYPNLNITCVVNTSRPLKDQRLVQENLKNSLNFPIECILPYISTMQETKLEGDVYSKLYPNKAFTKLLRTIVQKINPNTPDTVMTPKSFWQKLFGISN